jgi:hypothetical protein
VHKLDFRHKPDTAFTDVGGLSQEDARGEVEALREGIEYHDYRYYVKDKPFERLQTITPQIAQQYDLDPSWGVLVLDVRQFSAAAIAGLRRGNISTHVQGQKVTDVDELRKEVEDRNLVQGVRMRIRVPGGPARFVLLSLEE